MLGLCAIPCFAGRRQKIQVLEGILAPWDLSKVGEFPSKTVNEEEGDGGDHQAACQDKMEEWIMRWDHRPLTMMRWS